MSTQDVASWWEKNPFTYNGTQGVGKPNSPEMTLKQFQKIETRFRRHGSSYQKVGEPLLSNFIPYHLIRGKPVLDIACGTGVVAVEMARQDCSLTAIDITEFAVSTTKLNLKLRGLEGSVLRMDGQELEFPDGSFDFVSAHGCLMHMPNMDAALAEIFRVLRPGGMTYAWVYNKGWYFWFGIVFLRGFFLGKLLKYRFNLTKLSSRYSDGSHAEGNVHTIFLSSKELRRKYERCGFIVDEIGVVYNPADMDAFPTLKFPFGKFLPEFIRKFIGRKMGLGLRILARKSA